MLFKLNIANFLSTDLGLRYTKQYTLFQVRDTLADNLSSQTMLVDVAQTDALSNLVLWYSFEL